MKNTIYIVLLLLIHFSVKAQTEKGRWNAGVSIGSFSYQKNDFGKSFSASISPSAGYFVAKNWLLGIGIPFSYVSGNYTGFVNSQKNQSTTIGVSPFARYYIGPSKLKPYLDIAYTFSHSNYHTDNSIDEINSKSNSTTLTPSLGLAYFLNQNISLNAQLGYNWYSVKTTNDSGIGDGTNYSYKNATLGIGFNIFFGG
ncbi:outer membrane beta-barrel protein [Spirosoma sp. HMF4905]|uniref:Outer membrane beta-barrel protein n=1 Tax=Spirosoma arboris TaxID=2682092 RepID=A0A7K1S838_9BACT|nr:outer membrane beta-barrel protein [Spirosoma arboris]MVM29939.1 outer membrane beta-barrel protein [Spirosoma arboris]